MRKLKISKRNKNEFFLFLLCPLLSFMYSVKGMLRKEPLSLTMLSIFMGLCSFLWVPTGDLYRHNIEYFDFVNFSSDDLFQYMLLRPDFLLYLVSFLFAKLHIPFELVRFVLVFISYKIVFAIYKDVVKQSPIYSRYHKSIILIFFLSVQFFTISQGLRFGFAAYIMVWGIFLLLVNNRKKGFVFIVLANFIHYSFLLPTILLLIILLGFKVGKWVTLFLGSLFGVILNLLTIEGVIDFLPMPEMLKQLALAYTTGYWGGEFLDNYSFKYLLSRHLAIMPIYFLFCLIILKKENCKINWYAHLLFLNLIISYSISATLFFRMSVFSILIFFLAYLLSDKTFAFRYEIKALMIVFFISFLSQIYTYRRELTISSEFKILFPAPVAIVNIYSYDWLDENVYEDGCAKKIIY